MKIPVVDFGAYNLNEKDVLDDQLDTLSKELKIAFTEVGFVYLKNTGISQEEVSITWINSHITLDNTIDSFQIVGY